MSSNSGVQQNSDQHVTDTLMLQMLQTLQSSSSASGTIYTDSDSNLASGPNYRVSPDHNSRTATRATYEDVSVAQLHYELAQYKQAIAQKDQALSRKDEELSQMRITSLTLNHLIPDVPSPSIKAESISYDCNNSYGPMASGVYTAQSRDLNGPQAACHNTVNSLWANHDDARSASDRSDGIPSAFAKTQTIWDNSAPTAGAALNVTATHGGMPKANTWKAPMSMATAPQYITPRLAGTVGTAPFFDNHSTQAHLVSHPGAISDPCNAAPPLLPSSLSPRGYNSQYAGHNNQHGHHNHYGPVGSRVSPPIANGHTGYRAYPNGFHTPVSRLSPTATEFSFETSSSGPWNAMQTQQVFVPTTEPMNYRRLLERHMNTDWSYVVDKIIYNNDQQASIFLQQKLKLGTPDQKNGIISAITKQALGLMLNRFGNFLIQRCFEHGTEDQVLAIANTMEGNVVMLSMDAFGCHVVQKAFDCVSEKNKFNMVHELLDRIQDTVIHRYACHVWQKLFELRWNGPPPMIMDSVNRALKGRWHEVALGETGSLVVQNIFENCTEADKVFTYSCEI